MNFIGLSLFILSYKMKNFGSAGRFCNSAPPKHLPIWLIASGSNNFYSKKRKVQDYVSESSTVIGGQRSLNVGFRFATELRYYNNVI